MERHGAVLEKVGADCIVYPERDTGTRVAKSLVSSTFTDWIELSSEYSLTEAQMPEQWIGRSLSELRVREKYGVNVELIQAGTGELVKRIQSEKNDPYADVLFGGSWSLMYTNEDLWEPYVSANDANVIDATRTSAASSPATCWTAASSSSTPTSSATSRSRLRGSAEPGPEGQDRHRRPRQLLFRFRTPNQYAACNGRLRGR